MLREDFLLASLNKPRFPFAVGLAMLLLGIFMSCIASFSKQPDQMIIAAGGTELLLYLLANGLFSLGVKNFEVYIKKSLLAYILHLPFLGGFMYLLMGEITEQTRDALPVFGALIVSFFLSIGLVVLIRQVLSILREN